MCTCVVTPRNEPDELEHLVDAAAPDGGSESVQCCEELEVLLPGERRIEADLLRRQPDASPHLGRVADRARAEYQHVAARRQQQGGEHGERRRLARAVGAEEAERLAGGDLQGDPADRLEAPEAAGEINELDAILGGHGRIGVPPPPRPGKATDMRTIRAWSSVSYPKLYSDCEIA